VHSSCHRLTTWTPFSINTIPGQIIVKYENIQPPSKAKVKQHLIEYLRFLFNKPCLDWHYSTMRTTERTLNRLQGGRWTHEIEQSCYYESLLPLAFMLEVRGEDMPRKFDDKTQSMIYYLWTREVLLKNFNQNDLEEVYQAAGKPDASSKLCLYSWLDFQAIAHRCIICSSASHQSEIATRKDLRTHCSGKWRSGNWLHCYHLTKHSL
jgi:hypothetical protein